MKQKQKQELHPGIGSAALPFYQTVPDTMGSRLTVTRLHAAQAAEKTAPCKKSATVGPDEAPALAHLVKMWELTHLP